MQVPRLPVTGENFKKYAIDTLKAIIAYLHASRVRPGKGIRVEETPCGTVISIIPRGSAIQGGAGGITYEAGTGITITGGTPGVPEKINANITGGNDISVTGGTNGNPLVISYTGGGVGTIGIDSTVAGGTASVYLSGGTGSVKFTGIHGVAIAGGSAGEILIEGTGEGGIPYPDYASLADSSDVPADVPGIGTTYLLPVREGVAIKFATDGSNVFAKYAPGIGTTGGSAQVLAEGVSYTPGANGWVRIRVFDNGVDNGKCLRFFSGGVDWSGALPLYKYGTFDNGGGGGGGENNEYVWFGSVPPENLNDWIIEAEPNKTYNLYEEYVNSSSFSDWVYTSQWIYETYGIDADDGGNILVKLPTNLSDPCMIKIYAWGDSCIVVIAPDGKHIIDDNGTNTDSSEGFSGACLHVYVYQPNNSTYGTGVWRSQHIY